MKLNFPKRAHWHAVVTILVSTSLAAMTVSTQGLVPHHVSGEIHLTAPNLHFLTGRALSRLHDGAAVPFDFQLTIVTGGPRSTVLARSLERFTVSYDVWEEKFSVVRGRDLRKSGMRLSSNSAETWCLENIFVSAANLPSDQQLWARLEIRSAEPREPLSTLHDSGLPDTGINLATLIEIFSRPTRPQQDRWLIESAPFELATLKP